MNGKPAFDLEKAKILLAAGVTVNRDKLKEAANYLGTYLFTGNQEVDYADSQMMEAFELLQFTHHCLVLQSKTSQKTAPRTPIGVEQPKTY